MITMDVVPFRVSWFAAKWIGRGANGSRGGAERRRRSGEIASSLNKQALDRSTDSLYTFFLSIEEVLTPRAPGRRRRFSERTPMTAVPPEIAQPKNEIETP